MVFLGYILPNKNQKAYKNEIEISVQNNKQDLINRLGDLEEKPNVVLNNNPSVQDILQTPIKTLNDTNEIKRLGWTEYIGLIENVLKQYQLPATPANIEKAVEQADNVLALTNTATPEPPALMPSSNTPSLTIDTDLDPTRYSAPPSDKSNKIPSFPRDEFMNKILEQLKKRKVVNDEAEPAPKIETKIEIIPVPKEGATEDEIIAYIQAKIDAGQRVYGATGPNQSHAVQQNEITRKEDGVLMMDGGAYTPNFLPRIRIINSNKLPLSVTGRGINSKPKGMSAINHTPNFGGKYYLNLKSFRNGHLVLYRPKANTVLLSKRNISPTLSSIVKDMRAHNKFEIDEYEKLKSDEQKVVDHLINLLRMDTPATMKSTLADEVWQLKNRYEILLGEMRAGNDGVLVVQELKQVLKKLKENKVINKRKHDAIVSAIS